MLGPWLSTAGRTVLAKLHQDACLLAAGPLTCSDSFNLESAVPAGKVSRLHNLHCMLRLGTRTATSSGSAVVTFVLLPLCQVKEHCCMESLRRYFLLQNCKYLKMNPSVPSIKRWHFERHIIGRHIRSNLYKHSYIIVTVALSCRVGRLLFKQNITLLRLSILPRQDLSVPAEWGLLLNKPLHHCCSSIRLASSV